MSPHGNLHPSLAEGALAVAYLAGYRIRELQPQSIQQGPRALTPSKPPAGRHNDGILYITYADGNQTSQVAIRNLRDLPSVGVRGHHLRIKPRPQVMLP